MKSQCTWIALAMVLFIQIEQSLGGCYTAKAPCSNGKMKISKLCDKPSSGNIPRLIVEYQSCPNCPITWGEWKNLGPSNNCNHALMIREEICDKKNDCDCSFFKGGKKEGKCGNKAI
jgi:hypothetical protein